MGIIEAEDNKRKMIDIALRAGRRLQSPQTKFLHLCYEDPLATRQDTIATVENWLYVLALFRSKTLENVQEAKDLIAKLLPFCVEGNIPVYLHEYPACRDKEYSAQIIPVLFYLLKSYKVALGEELFAKLMELQEEVIWHLQELDTLSASAHRWRLASQHKLALEEWVPASPAEWAQWCTCAQMQEAPLQLATTIWDPRRGVYIGSSTSRFAESFEPAVTLLDLYMGQYYGAWSKRALEPHPIQVRAALVYPLETAPQVDLPDTSYTLLVEPRQRQCATLYFGDLECTHSLTVEAKKGMWQTQFLEKEHTLLLTYTPEETLPSEEESIECALYIDAHPDVAFQVSHAKATTFTSQEEVSFTSPFGKIDIVFTAEGGEWMGHIFKANRSFQKKTGGWSAYDWKVGWRTLRRQLHAKVHIRISFDIHK